MSAHEPAVNPLSRIALEAPPWAAPVLSAGGRVAGAAIAVYLAFDQSYDRTQVVCGGVALAALVTLVPLRGIAGAAASAFGAGAIFFAGAALGEEAPAAGIAMIVAGGAAMLGTLLAARREGDSPLAALGGFFAALPILVGAIAIVALAVEG